MFNCNCLLYCCNVDAFCFICLSYHAKICKTHCKVHDTKQSLQTSPKIPHPLQWSPWPIFLQLEFQGLPLRILNEWMIPAALDIHSPLTLDVDIVPSWPMQCMWAGVVHTQVQHNTGCACVRPTSNACTVGPERPPSCNFARASPVVHPRHSVNMWMWSSPRRAGDSDGHYYCIVEDGGKGKENQKRREWEKRWRNQQQRVAGRDLMPGVQGQSQ